MKLRPPALSLTSWAIIACVGLILFIGAGLARPSFLGFKFDPFGMDRRTIDNLTTERDFARSDASARSLEVEGMVEQQARIEAAANRAARAATIAAQATTEARSAPDADTPLDPTRADRLHAVDRELCALSPASCASRAAATDPAGSGDNAL